MTATIDGIEHAQSRNQVEASERWRQLILDTKNDVQRDGQESLEIMLALGKSIHDLRTEVKRLQEIDTLRAELQTLRADRGNFQKYSQEKLAEEQAYARLTAEHNQRYAELTQKLQKCNSQHQRTDAVVARLKDLGVQSTESIMQDLQRAIDRLTGSRTRALNDIARDQSSLDGKQQTLNRLAENLDRLVSGDDRLETLQAEYDDKARGIERDKEGLQRKRDVADNYLEEIQGYESRLRSIREQLLIDPHAEI